ncbi:helix-turn-helix domain-containing protein [Rhodococcus erythropolis]|uniref:helix-turn-helix domain-containing protein n=2 Tax=Rhodococcus TaxID=1827 RepID=UPI003467352B
MQLIETSTAAARLGVSDRNVRALAARGTLTARRVAGRWLIDADAVEERSQKRGNQLP